MCADARSKRDALDLAQVPRLEGRHQHGWCAPRVSEQRSDGLAPDHFQIEKRCDRSGLLGDHRPPPPQYE